MPAWKFELARRMRRKPTGLERDAARYLARVRPRLKPQVPMRGYIADRYCPAARVVVEVDGPFHDPIADARRDAHLALLDIVTIRLPMESDFAAGAEHVQRVIRARMLHRGKRGGEFPGRCAICTGDSPAMIARDERGALRGLVCHACAQDYRQWLTVSLDNATS